MGRPRHAAPASPLAWLAVLLFALGTARADDRSLLETLRFASEMAEQGNWREAAYRWELARQEWPQNPRILNNLAVAKEATGEFAAAREFYAASLERGGGEPRVLDNVRRFNLFLRERARLAAASADAPAEASPEVPPVPEVPPGKPRKKAIAVTVGLPIPPKLELAHGAAVLVASFLTDDTELLDTNRELVRFLRSEFRKRTDLEVLQVVPPPAIPEQTIPDLLANAEFWKHLAREHGADVIVSGVVGYEREDASGFRDVDTVSERTGQKVRETRFVDQEEFRYVLDVFFFDGASGRLLHRDRLRRSLTFAGAQNDPIAAFYELSESIAGDVLAVVVPRTRREPRVIFRK